MMLSESEAKTKWCPFTRYQGADEPASNRWRQSAPPGEPHSLNPIPCRCIASECMAWREHVIPERQEHVYNQPERPDGEGWVPFSESETNCAWARLIPEQRGGYCGLAGKVDE